MNFSILNKFRKLNNKLNYAENNGDNSENNSTTKIDVFLIIKTFIINMAYPTPSTNDLTQFLN